MTIYIKNSSIWKQVNTPYIRSLGVWETPAEVYVKYFGSWELVWSKILFNDRGIFGGPSNVIDVIIISTNGNAVDFGDLSVERYGLAACSNGINDRGIFGGGSTTSRVDIIDYVTISSTGNATDFGDLTYKRYTLASTSNGTNNRGVFGGGKRSSGYLSINIIDYVTISSTGNATDFGDLIKRRYRLAATSNGTNNRAIFGSGHEYTIADTNIMDFISISSTGNASMFGYLSTIMRGLKATSNGTNNRGIFAGGDKHTGNDYNIIDYITISSTGNSSNFGDLTAKRRDLAATSNRTNNRGIFGGGCTDGSGSRNLIDYISISSTGNALNFGDLTSNKTNLDACSNV